MSNVKRFELGRLVFVDGLHPASVIGFVPGTGADPASYTVHLVGSQEDSTRVAAYRLTTLRTWRDG